MIRNTKREFIEILDNLKGSDNQPGKEFKSQKEWLVCVSTNAMGGVGATGGILTSGTYEKFKEYCYLKDYLEEIDLVSGQDSGIKGVCLSNVKIVFDRSQNSLQILNAFKENMVFEAIKLVQVMRVGQDLQSIASISFQQCKITNVKTNLDVVEFFFKYGTRSETYSLVDEKGASQGSF